MLNFVLQAGIFLHLLQQRQKRFLIFSLCQVDDKTVIYCFLIHKQGISIPDKDL